MFTDKNYDIENLRNLRKAIGYIGLGLPIVLLIGSFISYFDTLLQPTLSHYFHTKLRDLFSFALFTVGFFFIKYKGYPNPNLLKNDTFLTNLAGIAAIAIAIFPTDYSTGINLISPSPSLFGDQTHIHYFFAVSLFFILALISINIFTLGTGGIEYKSPENMYYKVSGYAIIACMILAFILDYFTVWAYSTLFFETLILFLFSFSWLIKGRALGKMGEKLYSE